ncbi:DNA-binding protein [Metapseudomonas furukawaii]|uniref:DNA-binding protein n=1 Tax=Metapseudomonas furukawaii TaxID=1149133 RepID=UPI00227B13C3|nr:DNA-binding protein [Pseudomonas furukawaii]WAG77882.1 DNA-binding protein [Pseudomonas furukawaii]
MQTAGDRARALIKLLGPKRASELGGGNHDRWRSVSKGAVRVSTEEVDVLVQAFPQYALWLASGQIAPEIGQTSPAYDEARSNLQTPSTD